MTIKHLTQGHNIVEVLWYTGVDSLLPFLWPEFDSRHCLTSLSFNKTLHPHCCSIPRGMNWYLVGCK